MNSRASRLPAGLLVLATTWSPHASTQEMEPRSYSPNPVGVTFVLAAFARSTGGILTDPSLPVDDVEGEVDATALGVGHTFGLFGRSASAGIVQPRISGHFTGTLDGQNAEASRSGIGDTKLKFTTNLMGAPAISAAEFAQRRPETTLGASLVVSAPTGDYHSDKLINVGTNRWAVKPEIGLSHPVGRWTFEGIAGVWIFEDNDDFFGGRHREQEPLASVQAHVSYTLRPRLWLAFNATYYDGGRTTIDGVKKDDRQSNSRYGLTLSMPVAQRQSLKLNWNDGATTRIGSDFSTWGIAWQYTILK
jgi:Putative MetA-pathway of phenol degradation